MICLLAREQDIEKEKGREEKGSAEGEGGLGDKERDYNIIERVREERGKRERERERQRRRRRRRGSNYSSSIGD